MWDELGEEKDAGKWVKRCIGLNEAVGRKMHRERVCGRNFERRKMLESG